MLKSFVQQSASAPGTASSINLIAPPTDRVAFSAVFASGASVFYFMDDDTQAEWGWGAITAGTPDTLARTTVIGNTAGTTARLNFSGTVRVYNEVPGEWLCYLNSTGFVSMPGPAIVPADPSTAAAILVRGRLSDDVAAVWFQSYSAASNWGVIQSSSAGLDVLTGATPTQRMRVDATGNIIFGAGTSTSPISTSTEGFSWRVATGVDAYSATGPTMALGTGGTTLATFYKTTTNVGSITVTGSTTAYNTTSDYRAKRVDGPLTGALGRLAQMRCYTGVYLAEPGVVRDLMLAHEVAAVVPEAVHGAKDAIAEDGTPIYQQADWTKCVPLLVAALQEAVAQIGALSARLSALENRG